MPAEMKMVSLFTLEHDLIQPIRDCLARPSSEFHAFGIDWDDSTGLRMAISKIFLGSLNKLAHFDGFIVRS